MNIIERFKKYRTPIFKKGSRFLTEEETKINRPRNLERQRLLKDAGYNVEVGKPWGSWQQTQWENYIKSQPIQNTHEDAQKSFTQKLDNWIKNNPKMFGINTKQFRNFLISLAATESSFDPDAVHGSQYGYFQIKGLQKGQDQFKAAFKHLNSLFNNSITKADLDRAKDLGITQGELLAKYWNQQNRVTNYIHRGVDAEDGVGTKVSQYHNNDNISLDYSQYVPEAITSVSEKIVDQNSLADIIARARNEYIDYSDREKYILDLNKEIDSVRTGGEKYNAKKAWNPNKLKKNSIVYTQPIWSKIK